jgi:hypothetical protein
LQIGQLFILAHKGQNGRDKLDLAGRLACKILAQPISKVIVWIYFIKLKSSQLRLVLFAERLKGKVELPLIALFIAFKNSFFKDSFNFSTNFQNGRFYQCQYDGLCILKNFFLFFGTAPSELFPLGFLDVVNIIFLEVVLVLDVGVRCSVGQVALPALAEIVPTLWVLALATRALTIFVHSIR